MEVLFVRFILQFLRINTIMKAERKEYGQTCMEREQNMFVMNLQNGIQEVSHTAVENPSECSYYKHMHHCCELLLMIEGDVDFYIGGDYYHLNSYDLLLIPKGTYHYLNLCSITRYENYIIYFDDTVLPLEKFEKLFQSPAVFNIGTDFNLLHLFHLLDVYYEMYDKQDFCRCAAFLATQILTYLCYVSRLSAPVIKTHSILVGNILKYIDEHLEETINIDVLADHFELSRSHIQNVFSQEMQIGLKKYVTLKKILAAHSDLLHGMAATKAAAKYNFNEYSSFFRLYKRIFGCAPSSAEKNTGKV